VIIDEKRIITADEKMLSREVVLEKFANDKESLKIMVKDPILEGRSDQRLQNKLRSHPSQLNRSNQLALTVRSVRQGAAHTSSSADPRYRTGK
jgi:hypothetical protein